MYQSWTDIYVFQTLIFWIKKQRNIFLNLFDIIKPLINNTDIPQLLLLFYYQKLAKTYEN